MTCVSSYDDPALTTHSPFCLQISAIEILPTDETSPRTCNPVPINFDYSANGVPLQGGTYVSDQWAALGMSLSTTGGLANENRPRLFNTSDVGNDPDLGAPNKWCTPPGPGKGSGGEPGGAGPNCDPLGNVLIVQTSDKTITIPGAFREFLISTLWFFILIISLLLLCRRQS